MDKFLAGGGIVVMRTACEQCGRFNVERLQGPLACVPVTNETTRVGDGFVVGRAALEAGLAKATKVLCLENTAPRPCRLNACVDDAAMMRRLGYRDLEGRADPDACPPMHELVLAALRRRCLECEAAARRGTDAVRCGDASLAGRVVCEACAKAMRTEARVRRAAEDIALALGRPELADWRAWTVAGDDAIVGACPCGEGLVSADMALRSGAYECEKCAETGGYLRF